MGIDSVILIWMPLSLSMKDSDTSRGQREAHLSNDMEVFLMTGKNDPSEVHREIKCPIDTTLVSGSLGLYGFGQARIIINNGRPLCGSTERDDLEPIDPREDEEEPEEDPLGFWDP